MCYDQNSLPCLLLDSGTQKNKLCIELGLDIHGGHRDALALPAPGIEALKRQY